MEGTVIWARRAEGLVDRAGSAVKVAASGRGGMARGSAGTDLDGGLAAPPFDLPSPLTIGCLATGFALDAGAAFLAAGVPFAGVFLAGAAFAVDFAAALGGAFAVALAGAFAATFTGALRTGAFAAGLATGFLAAGFALLAAFAAGLALAAGFPALAPSFGCGFTSWLLTAAALAWDRPARAVLSFSGDR